jgi:hypothetical protein
MSGVCEYIPCHYYVLVLVVIIESLVRGSSVGVVGV